jgi:hypothetical protein
VAPIGGSSSRQRTAPHPHPPVISVPLASMHEA